MTIHSPIAEFEFAVAAMRRGDYRPAAEIRDERRSGPYMGIGSKHATKDLTMSARWLQSVAESGLAEAQHFLGVAFEIGEVVFWDSEASRHYHQLAALQGFARAQCSLGRLLCFECSDIEAGIRWIRSGADQHDARSQYELGMMYFRGMGVSQNKKNAAVWMKKAAEQGLARAQYQLSKMYGGGDAEPENVSDAVSLLQRAAVQGHAPAQFDLAMRYKEGRGVDKDDREAFGWFLRAAEQGDVGSQRAVAVAYIAGDGVEVDHDRAVDWLIELPVDVFEDAAGLLHVLSDPHWREKYETAMARNDVNLDEDERASEQILAVRSRRKGPRKWAI
jgi:TPR repeat protein